MEEKRLKKLAEEIADALVDAKDPLEAVKRFKPSVSRGDACKIAEALRPLVGGYAAIEEGSFWPSPAYTALKNVLNLFERMCRGSIVDDELVALALGILGLLEKGLAVRASVISSIIASRLTQTTF